MKNIKNYILESTESEDLEHEIGLALQNFGSVRNGFKLSKIEDVVDAMYTLGFDYAEDEGKDDEMIFYGEYIDNKYQVILYSKEKTNDKVKLFNFHVFED